MKKTININLGQTPFIIDEDAYESLNNYLHNLHMIFDPQDPSIVADIEYRFAEILTDKLGKNTIVTLNDIEAGIEQIGSVESISDTDTPYNIEQEHDGKLYKDLDNKLISGVSSGISHFLGVKEVVFIRIFFLLTIFTPISLIYVLLWATLPTKHLADIPVGKFKLKKVFKEMLKEVEIAIKSLSRKLSGSTFNT